MPREAAARDSGTRLDELLGDHACGTEPHGGQHAEQRSQGTEGRSFVHGVDESRVARRRDSTPRRTILPAVERLL
jgi:hypothetical protein